MVYPYINGFKKKGGYTMNNPLGLSKNKLKYYTNSLIFVNIKLLP